MLDKELLDSKSYLSSRPLPYEKKVQYIITIDDVFNEMAVRTFQENEIPECLPIITRAQWIGPHAVSPKINPGSGHRIEKYSCDNIHAKIDAANEDYSLRRAVIPSYIRTMTKMVDTMPKLFSRMLPGYHDESDE
jgi:hypothetical protein